MSDIILKVENISKQYRLGVVGTGTISHDLNRWWHKVRGKEDPFLKIGESNDRATKGDSDYVWALKDINFEVKRGEVLGIIGKNGAGKSTLLKILSKVTAPTTGIIKSKGRIASLLEVGTGFHPEMTGKENIFLNGAILGMTKKEIKAKLDEIVVFSGCERYIDTPVKRYSSGMKVRLAFAVAAHLEPDILVVDEVLAVGDAEFQKKAIGKMQDISNTEGRTVLFVSHDMVAIENLCSRVLWLENGILFREGKTINIIREYLSRYSHVGKDNLEIATNKKIPKIKFHKLWFEDLDKNEVSKNAITSERFKIHLGFNTTEVIKRVSIAYTFKDIFGKPILTIWSRLTKDDFINLPKKGVISCEITDIPLFSGKYGFHVWIAVEDELYFSDENFCDVTIAERDFFKSGLKLNPKNHGHTVVYNQKWDLNV